MLTTEAGDLRACALDHAKEPLGLINQLRSAGGVSKVF